MSLYDDVMTAARQAHADHRQVRERIEYAAQRILHLRPRTSTEPPTLTIDDDGRARADPAPGALVTLGRSLALAATALFAAGMAWLGTFFLWLYLLVARLLGLRVHVEQAHPA